MTSSLRDRQVSNSLALVSGRERLERITAYRVELVAQAERRLAKLMIPLFRKKQVQDEARAAAFIEVRECLRAFLSPVTAEIVDARLAALETERK